MRPFKTRRCKNPGASCKQSSKTTTKFEFCYALRIDCVSAMYGQSSEAWLGKGRAALLDIAKSQWGRLRRGGVEALGFSAAPRHRLTAWHQGSHFGGDSTVDVIGALARQGLEPIHSRHAHAVVLAARAATSWHGRLPGLRESRECAGQQQHQHRT